jgi:hypothetical protein
VVARDHTCIFPHCNRPARSCEIDHGKDWRSAGRPANTTCIPYVPGIITPNTTLAGG